MRNIVDGSREGIPPYASRACRFMMSVSLLQWLEAFGSAVRRVEKVCDEPLVSFVLASLRFAVHNAASIPVSSDGPLLAQESLPPRGRKLGKESELIGSGRRNAALTAHGECQRREDAQRVLHNVASRFAQEASDQPNFDRLNFQPLPTSNGVLRQSLPPPCVSS